MAQMEGDRARPLEPALLSEALSQPWHVLANSLPVAFLKMQNVVLRVGLQPLRLHGLQDSLEV